MDRPCARFGGWFKEETQLRHRFAFPLSHDNTSNTVSMNENPSTNCTADIDTRVRREYTTVSSVLWCCMQHNVHGTCIRSICYCRLWLKTRCKLVDYGCCSGMDWLLELHVLRQAVICLIMCSWNWRFVQPYTFLPPIYNLNVNPLWQYMKVKFWNSTCYDRHTVMLPPLLDESVLPLLCLLVPLSCGVVS